MRTALYLFAALALAAPLVAPAVTRAAPWAGGDATVTPLEQRIGDLVSGLAGTPAAARCASPRGWRELGAQLRFDPDGILGIVPWTPENAPEPWTALSPSVCRQVAAFVRKPRRVGQKNCRADLRVR